VAHAFDPFDPGQAQRAWPLLAELRRAGPVAALDGGMHYVARHAECRAALRDTDAFSNAAGMKAPGVEIPYEDRILGELDPPQHSVVRRVMVTALTPKVVHAAEPFIRDTAAALLDAVPAHGFAGAFPAFAGYIDEKVARRAGELDRGDDVPDDVLTRLIRLEVDGERLSGRQLRALTRNLITGGLTTTSQLLGNLVYQLLTVPGLEEVLRGAADAVVPAIEESLRLAPPVLFVARGCVRDTAIGDTPVQAGERVIVGTGSANRDERVFDDGDTFRVDRPNADQHLAFGYGPHVCPGASLARVVARIGVAAFLDRFPPGSVRLAPGYEFENVPTFFEIGPRRLPVETGA
jgi:cytochrome P450